MFPFETIMLVITVTWSCTAIRVDWNTNKGPILPPPVRTTVRPSLPYREPAPVWEDLSDDISNPNPYKYVLPPPSRPRQDNYLTLTQSPIVYNNYQYGKLIYPNQQNVYLRSGGGNSKTVAGLTPQYFPNFGVKYVAIVPQVNEPMPVNSRSENMHKQPYHYNYSKQQAKYNPKTKKYKAHEKIKNTPFNDLTYYETKESGQRSNMSEWNQQKRLKRNNLASIDVFKYILESEKSKLELLESEQFLMRNGSLQKAVIEIFKNTPAYYPYLGHDSEIRMK